MKLLTTNVFFLISVLIFCGATVAQNKSSSYYGLTIYHYHQESQGERLDAYLKNALVPALHRAGIRQVGVFKTSPQDTASIKKIFVLTPYPSLGWLDSAFVLLGKDKAYTAAADDYLNSRHDQPAFDRFERILIKGFSGMPGFSAPKLTAEKKNRVYELRSYESANESLYRSKVKMFNEGDEIAIFEKLKFNAVFYGDVLAGSHMPNLMYMVAFENMAERDEHWKQFGEDAAWIKLKSDKQYDNTVSHIDNWFLYPAEYSDL